MRLRSSLTLLACVLGLALCLEGAEAPASPRVSGRPGLPGDGISPGLNFGLGEVLAEDEFSSGLGQWRVEAEPGARVEAKEGRLEIDAPGGCTVWFSAPFEGPLLISYEATAVSAGGPNDRVSDLNCFWMASDARNPADLFAVSRSGVFADYDQLRCYYVGLGANSNSTTRFRRYLGQSGNRPLLPEHDLRATDALLVPGTPQGLQLVAAGGTIAFLRDGRQLFSFQDPEPYSRGHFAFRTVKSHLILRHFRVQRLSVVPATVGTSISQ